MSAGLGPIADIKIGIARIIEERDDAQAAARSLLALAQFPSAEERLQFIDAHPWLKEDPRHVCDENSGCPAHQEDAAHPCKTPDCRNLGVEESCHGGYWCAGCWKRLTTEEQS